MITLLIIATVFVAVALGAIVRQDGYGHRPAPRSHVDPYPTHNPFI